MAASNNRFFEYDSVYHLMSRVAHKVYILNDEDRNDLIEIFRRTAEFTGIKLLGWCLMTNHFHLLAYLPPRENPDETEILRRYAVLKGAAIASAKEEELMRLRSSGATDQVDAWFDRQRKRMYDIGSFMKIAKQWFTEDYNRRYSHVGTLWEGEYLSKGVEKTSSEMVRRLAYIHLNPIRAGITARFDDYIWSSFTAFRRGDPIAKAGFQFVYQDWENRSNSVSQDELGARHEELLNQLLEVEKRHRAEEIARRRASGQKSPCDPLTSEALVIQAAAHLDEVRRAGASIWENRSNLFSQIELEVVRLLYLDPSLSIGEICAKLSLTKSTVYRAVDKLRKKQIIERLDRSDSWFVDVSILGK